MNGKNLIKGGQVIVALREFEKIDKKQKRNWKKIISWIIGVTLLLTIAALVGISIYVGHQMTHPEKKPIDQSPKDHGIAYDEATFLSEDGETELSGWVLHPEREAKMTLIFAHGYKGNRFEDHIPFFSMAENLLERDYRIVMFDFRYAGESGGDLSTVGAKEQDDLLGVINWVQGEYAEPVGLLGISMGGSTAILSAAKSEEVVGVVADSPFSDLEDYLRVNLPVWSDLPNFPFTPLILTIMPLLYDLDPKEASPISVLDDVAPRPILFIHNKGDESIPYAESELMVAEHPDHFSLWLIDGDGHVTAYKQNEAEYVEKVDTFFSEIIAD